MKKFHISDVLSVTTGRLVSSRHMDGIYEILNFLTGDNLFTHQLPRAMRECEPWLKTQYPQLMADSPQMKTALNMLDGTLAVTPQNKNAVGKACQSWVDDVRQKLNLPETLPVHEMGADMHTHIDPIEEAQAMMGDKKVIAVNP
jgi:hypothetical protein